MTVYKRFAAPYNSYIIIYKTFWKIAACFKATPRKWPFD